jgi:hypothetical protein
LLASFRAHYCREVIHSEQCIRYVFKGCTKNTDAGWISVQNVFYEGIPSLELINWSIVLQLVFHPPQNASLAFVDIGDTI